MPVLQGLNFVHNEQKDLRDMQEQPELSSFGRNVDLSVCWISRSAFVDSNGLIRGVRPPQQPLSLQTVRQAELRITVLHVLM